MKKHSLGLLAAVFLLAGALAACGNKEAKSDSNTIVVGASAIPHAAILKHVQPELKKEGINLKVKVFSDYVLPNKALASGELDANYYQHKPFLKKANKDNGYDLVSVGSIHLEPLGLYSKQVKKLSDVKSGAKVLVSSSQPDWGRVLTILKDGGLITLKSGVNAENATFKDIASNPKYLKFEYTFEPKLMPELLKNDEGTLVAINSNYAVQAGLNPEKDAVALEKQSSPFANIVVTNKKDRNNPAIKKLVKALKSKSTQEWIKNKWHGAVLPVE
ncbi:MetQ/NlpA family ABC transporter substrate-binding protein [Latilactobacillus curvatus]|uniref:MetQ/NlpA family ABC transporter substrate-binding protein n=1 Tax=Latilactobacillus curvatus TaxID=28038 RepID=UPI0024DF9780|nr:MetQ/NlpA family ABC transporter substrate-binding protein [Latilactobacillus curvatus]WIE01699.1 MetQ/NlpA family ABC transporter substrate-binding protein [Latilactobacillus curvatus]